MFGDILGMFGTYESRKVGRYEEGDVLVSTCRVTDGDYDYETAVAHPKYNGGDFIIVEAYDDEAAAKAGHEKWVATMTAKDLPESLKDVNNAHVSQLGKMLGRENWRTDFKRED